MQLLRRFLTAVPALYLLFTGCQAQTDSKINFSMGVGLGLAQGRASDFVGPGGSFVGSIGYNLSREFGLAAEYTDQFLPIKRIALDRIRAIEGESRLYALNASAIFRFPTRGRLGFYVIGGGGWYCRKSKLTQPTLTSVTVCSPDWEYWAPCANGLVVVDQVLASRTSDAFGGNVGSGFTVRMDERMKFFIETRYHYAPHDLVPTRTVPITLGFRW